MSAVAVDRVIVELEARVRKYVTDMGDARKAHNDWKSSVLAGDAPVAASAKSATRASAERVKAEERASLAAARTAAANALAAARSAQAEAIKGRAATSSAEATERAATRSARAAEKRAAAETVANAKIVRAFGTVAAGAQAAAAAEEAAQTRISAVAERALSRQAASSRPGTGKFNTTGYAVQPGERSAVATPHAVNDGAALEDEGRINFLMRDRIDLQSRLTTATGREAVALQDQITELRLIDQYKKAGLTETEAISRAELRINAIQAERLALQRRDQTATVLRNVVSIAGTIGRVAAIGALLGAAGLGAGAAQAIEFAQGLKAASDQLGVTTRDLQVYQADAERLGVTNDQLRTSFSQFATSLGQAKEGSRSFQAIFRALGVDIRQFASAGDALPTVIDRISQIADPAQRAAIETQLFGEAGRRLDSMLGGGLGRLNQFADSMDRTGQVLSDQDVAQLNSLALALGNIKRELEVSFAHVVAENAGSILQLAQSFATLATSVIQALGAIGRFRAQAVFRTSEGPEREQARGQLMRSPEGRQYLMGDVRRRLGDISNVDPGNDPAAREAVRQRRQALIHEGAGVMYGDLHPPEASNPSLVAQPGRVNVAALGRLRAPAGPRGPSAETLEKQAAAREQNYQRQLEQFEGQRIDALRQQTANDDTRADMDRASIEREFDRTKADIELQVREHRIDAYRKDELVSAARIAANERERAVNQEEREAERQNELHAIEAGIQTQTDLWHAAEDVADTIADRRTAELALLDLAERQERADLEAVLASEKSSDAQKRLAQQRLDILNQLTAARRSGVLRATESPLEAYQRSLNRTGAQINEDLQGVAVSGLTKLNDGLADAITGAKSLGEVFHDVANEIITDLLRIAIQQAIIKPLANSLFGGGGGGGGSSFLSSITRMFGGGGGGGAGAIDPFIGFAGGGRPPLGKISVVGENGPELFVPDGAGTIVPQGKSLGFSGASAAHAPQITYVTQELHLDLTNAVLTPQLVAQMNDLADQAATRGAQGGVVMAERRAYRRARQAL